ncbi:RNA/RNP complex-1-interacting phosphatase-like [Centroberyx gerrardi]
MMPYRKKKNGIPDRWLEYDAVGKRVPGTRFIAFKVPLKQSLNSRVPESDAFGPWDLLDSLERENHELGLIIDLTFTTRYYKLWDVPELWSYVKILTEGHHIPSDATILSFKQAVRRFLRDNADNDKLIGVHCTHGLNRTGYLVCRYLIDVDGLDPQAAVELFNSSRGHHIERQNYLEDLQSGPKRSNEGMDESEQEPARGRAAERPPSFPIGSDPREESRPHSDERRRPRAQHRRPAGHQPCLRPPQGGLLPLPALLPTPPLPLLMAPYRTAPPHSQHHWSPAHPDAQRRRPLHPEGTRPRTPPEPGTNEPNEPNRQNGQNQSEERAGPRKKPRHRPRHRK